MILIRNKQQIIDGSKPTQYQLGSKATSKCSDSEEHYASQRGAKKKKWSSIQTFSNKQNVPAQAYDEGEVLCVYCEQTR